MIGSGTAGGAGFNSQDHTILVVDDNPTNLAVMVDHLSDRGFQVMVARDGETAITLAGSEQPDLILLDVMMPGIDGFETCRRLKANPKTESIIVIFMTVLAETEDKVMGFTLGAVDYVTKPFEPNELLARVTTHLRLKDLTENLGQKVRQQTKELTEANRRLQQEVEEHKKAETALRESEGRYRAAIENSHDGVAIIESGRYVFFNQRLLQILRYDSPDELAAKPVDFIFHPDDKKRVIQYNRDREAGLPVPERYEAKGLTKTGHTVYFDVSAARITYQDRVAILAFFTDITQRKELETKLQQAQKMEAIGTMAGGIAHDFNNILAIIIGNAELATMDPELNPGTRTKLDNVLGVGTRASELVQQILTFSRQTDLVLRPVKLGSLVRDFLKMLRATLPSSIEIRTMINDHHSMIMADATQVHQVLLNLCTNAAHAMPDQGGLLQLALDRIEIGGDDASQLDIGPYLRLSVTDNGHGMDQLTLERIFTPYFTTKNPDKGTGLGLAVVHGIVTSYGGDIRVHSKPGGGTSFDLLFPITHDGSDASALGMALGELPLGDEHILFVDDEELVVSVSHEILEYLGYRVTSTNNSGEAWELFAADPKAYDLVITDLTMPHLTGDALAQKMLALRPDLPILVCTGYGNRLNREQAKSIGIKASLTKPLVISQMAHAIREALDS